MRDVGRFSKIRCVPVYGGSNIEKQTRMIRQGVGNRCRDSRPPSGSFGTPAHFQFKKHSYSGSGRSGSDVGHGLPAGHSKNYFSVPAEKTDHVFSPPRFRRKSNSWSINCSAIPKVVDISTSLPASNVAQMIYPVSRTQKEALLQAIF